MKRIGLVGLATAILASTALLGAGSASATTICMGKTNPCPPGETYGLPKVFSGPLKKAAKFNMGAGGTVTCNESEIVGEAQKNMGANKFIGSEVTFIGYEKCTAPCTVKESNLPYAAEIKAAGMGAGTLVINNSGKGTPGVSIVCGAMTCNYGAASSTAVILGGAPGSIETSITQAKQAGSAFLCAPTAVWESEYEIKSPSPFWVQGEP